MDDLNRRLTLLKKLTPRQRQVLALKAQGMSLEEISAALIIEKTTVKYHIGQILDKLEIADLTLGIRLRELVLFGEVLKQMPPDSAPLKDEPQPPPPSPRALLAVEEDERALVPTGTGDIEPFWLPPKPDPRPWWRKPWLLAAILVISSGLISGLVVVVVVIFLFRGVLPVATPSTPVVIAPQATPTPQIIERTVTVVVTQPVTVLVTQVVPQPVVITATPAPTSIPTVERTQVIQQPVEVTRVVEVTRIVSQVVTATPVPSPTAQTGVLQFGESFSGQNMILTAKAPHGVGCNTVGYTDGMAADFTVENRTGGPIYFDGQTKGFYLDFGTTQRFIADGTLPSFGNCAGNGKSVVALNDFADRSSQDFGVTFPISPTEFDSFLRDKTVNYVEVVAEGFDPRVPKATWRKQVLH